VGGVTPWSSGIQEGAYFTLEEVAVALGHVTKKGTPAVAMTARYTQPNREQMRQKLNQITL
jgi:hypothetical protein